MNTVSQVTQSQKSTRRFFTLAEKQRIVGLANKAITQHERGEVTRLLQREGITSSHLWHWRQQVAAVGDAHQVAVTAGVLPGHWVQTALELSSLALEAIKAGDYAKAKRLASAVSVIQEGGS